MKRWVLFVLIFILISSVACLYYARAEKENSSPSETVRPSVAQIQPSNDSVPVPKSIPRLTSTQIAQLWNVTRGTPNVLIAVLDTGIDKNHKNLADKVIDEVNFTDSPTVSDVYGHGTHIAGIILAATENGAGTDNVACGCRLLNVKVADDQGRFQSPAVAEGIRWAVDHGAKVINISLVTEEPSLEMEEAVNYAWEKGVVVVAAAGNLIGDKLAYPAYYQNCLAVTVIDDNTNMAPWASQGDWVDIAAPGMNVYSTSPDDEYDVRSGTSFAAAHVSGLAGLLFSLESDRNHNGFVNDEVRARIENGLTTDNITTAK